MMQEFIDNLLIDHTQEVGESLKEFVFVMTVTDPHCLIIFFLILEFHHPPALLPFILRFIKYLKLFNSETFRYLTFLIIITFQAN